MLKINDATIDKIANSIVDYIKSQGKLLHKTPKAGGGSNKLSSLKKKREAMLTPLELDFRKGIVPLFKQQRDKVITALQGGGKSLVKDIKDDAKRAAAIPASKAEIAKLTEYTMPKITYIVEAAGNVALAELGISVAFDVLNPRVVDWLKKHAAEAVTGIGDTTRAALNKTLLEGIENGESIAKLTKRVQETYKPLELEAWRAKRIAMYETKSAAGKGSFEGYKQSGLTGKKGILLGPRPCELCLEFEGMGLIDINDTWGGFDCPTFHIGCMCDIYFVPDEKQGEAGEFEPAGSIGEAEEYATKFSRGVSYKGLDLKTVNLINENLDEIFNKYKLKPIWGIETRTMLHPARADYVKQRLILSTKLKDKNMITGIERYLKNGYVAGGKSRNIKETFQRIIDHEIAHLQFNEATKPVMLVNNMKKIKMNYVKALNEAKKAGNMELYNKLKISFYAKTDIHEFSAEAFNDYRFSKTPSIYSKQAYDIILEAIKAK